MCPVSDERKDETMGASALDVDIRWVEAHLDDLHAEWEPYGDVLDRLLAVARRVGAAETVEWCLEHGASRSDDSNEAWCETAIFEDWVHTERNGPKPKPCRIESRLLVGEV